MTTIVSVSNLTKIFNMSAPLLPWHPKRQLVAVSEVSFDIGAGETLAIVGESGCGKSTIAKLLVGLLQPTKGSIAYPDGETGGLDVNMIFQDPYSSLNPHWTVGRIVAEPIRKLRKTSAAEIREEVEGLLVSVGLRASDLHRRPADFSGGQRQRIAIARALASQPRFLICDEPTSALDVSVQAQILSLLRELQEKRGISYLFISHNLAVVRQIAHRTAVMYLGRIMEMGETEELFRAPKNPYTRMLMASVPSVDNPGGNRPQVLTGELPTPLDAPPGCAFSSRCPQVQELCRSRVPTLEERAAHAVACHVEQRRVA